MYYTHISEVTCTDFGKLVLVFEGYAMWTPFFFGQPDPGLFASALTFTVQSWWYFNCRSYIRCALITRFLSAQLMDNVQHLQLQFAACRCQRPISKHAGPHLIFRFIYLSTNATVCFLIFFRTAPLQNETISKRNRTVGLGRRLFCAQVGTRLFGSSQPFRLKTKPHSIPSRTWIGDFGSRRFDLWMGFRLFGLSVFLGACGGAATIDPSVSRSNGQPFRSYKSMFDGNFELMGINFFWAKKVHLSITDCPIILDILSQ